MAGKRSYNTEEALQIILSLSDVEDSDISDLEDDDGEADKLTDVPLEQIELVFEQQNEIFEHERFPEPVSDENDQTVDEENTTTSLSTSGETVATKPPLETKDETAKKSKKTKKPPPRVYRWRKITPPIVDSAFKGDNFSKAPEDFEELTPLSYFKQFFTDELIDQIVEETNLYSVQQTGKSIATTKNEIEQFIGIQIRMSIVRMTVYRHYWASNTRYAPIADVMSLQRYENLRRFLHFNDNSKRNDPDNKDKKLYKIYPVIDYIRARCNALEQESSQSIDEQIIPAKTKRSGIRQYNPRKPVKWGFKMFVRSGVSGIMYDFFLYCGANSTRYGDCSSKSSVLELCANVPPHQNYKIFFDNWFCTLELLLKLKEIGILAVGTTRSDRIAKCPLKTNKEMQKEGRGAMDYRVDANTGLRIIKWLDNGPVHLASTYEWKDPMSEIERFDSTTKKYIKVQCPAIVKAYNGSMGGVDLSDMFLSLYRTKINIKRWYIKVFFHCVDIAKINSWGLYKRFAEQNGKPKRSNTPLLEFTRDLSEGLLKAGKTKSNVPGRPKRRSSLDTSVNTVSKKGRKPSVPLPDRDSRYDSLGHWPEHRSSKGRCKMCPNGYSRVACSKCNTTLCLNKERNCFKDFHNK